jgi:hypothetical protein
MAVEVGTHGDHHRALARIRGATAQLVDESAAFVVVPACGEQLLELIDDEHGAFAGRGLPERAQGVLAGTDQRPRPPLAAGQDAARERVQEAGADDRGLAAARWPDHAQQRSADEPGDDLGDEPLAPEEVFGVVDVVRGEALVRADGRPLVLGGQHGGAIARRLEVADAHRQLGVPRAGLAAARRRSARRRIHSPGGFAAGPLARRLVDATRDAVARGEQPVDGHGIPGGPSVGGRDGSQRVGVERLEHHRLARIQSRERGRLLARGHRKDG